MAKIVDFDIETARMGQTVRHVESQQHYIVAAVIADRAIVRSVRGQLGIVGQGCLDPNDFVEVKHNRYMI